VVVNSICLPARRATTGVCGGACAINLGGVAMLTSSLPTELARVLALPIRQLPAPWEPERRPGATMELRPIQAEALAEIRATGAGLVSAGVGHGKTLIGLLAGAALGVDRTVYIAPAACVAQVEAELERANENWILPPVAVVSWSSLSGAKAEALLDAAAGHGTFALVADEAHVLRSSTSARTRRWCRFRGLNVERSRVVLMSGTLTRRHLLDLTDVAWLALGKRSPVPTGSTAAALELYLEDPRLGRGVREAQALRDWAGVADVAEALGARIRSAPGVVTTSSQSVDCPIYVVPIKHMPEARECVAMADQVAATFRVPDGDDLVTASDVARAQRQLSLGYRMVWVWPGEPDRTWIEARRSWAATVRAALATDYAERHRLDSELVLMAHAVRAESPFAADLRQARARVADVLDDPNRAPQSKPAWLTGKIMERLIDTVAREPAVLVWYDERAVAEYLRTVGATIAPLGERVDYGQGLTAVSLRSHATGLNCQRWSRNLYTTVPPSGQAWEQSLGRTHRPGQDADAVLAWRPAWCRVQTAAWQEARKSAEWIQSVTGQRQKLSIVQEVENGDLGF